MKKIILLLLCALLSTAIYGQNKGTQHIKFKGIPIDGSCKEFAEKLGQEGFQLDTIHLKNKNEYQLKGEFAGFKNCYIILKSAEGKDLLMGVTVEFPLKLKEPSIEDYKSLKKMLTLKYGKPSSCVEDKIRANNGILNIKDVEYKVEYLVPGGAVVLWIQSRLVTHTIKMRYIDKLNLKISENNVIEDL